MPPRIDTPAPPPGSLVIGTYRVGPRFNTYRDHGTNDWLLVYNLSGHARFGHASGEILSGPGEMILIKPKVRHDYGTAAGESHWEPLWAHFIPRIGWHEWLEWPEAAPGIMRLRLPHGAAKTAIITRFRSMLKINTGTDRLRRELALNALEEIILRCDSVNPKGENSRMDMRIRTAMDYISSHFAEPLTVPLIAERCGLSPSRLAHLFRANTGETPQRYLEALRLNRAQQLLEFTQSPIRHIAEAVGFSNPFYFTLRFKQQCGMSPRAWRQQIAARRAQ